MSRRRRGLIAFASAVVLAVAGVAIVVGTSSDSSARVIPPLPVLGAGSLVYNGDLGDPFLLVTPSSTSPRYVLLGTSTPPYHVPTATSDDLVHWTTAPDAVPTLPPWAAPDPGDGITWAPAVMAVGGRYVMYVTVHDVAADRQCIAVMTATSPSGPYRSALGGPLVCQVPLGGSIDPAITAGADGPVLLWRSAGITGLYSQRLRPDGLALLGESHLLLTPDRPWQDKVMEEPAAIPASSGGWWLFYSGSAFNRASYATGLAYCPTLDGPCHETSGKPFILASGGQLSNPASLETFRTPDGTLYAVYDTWSRPARNGTFFCCRPVSIAKILSH